MKANTKKIAIVILTVLTIFSATAFAQPSGQGMNRMSPMPGTGPGGQGMSPFIEPTEIKAHLRFAGVPYALNITSYDNQSQVIYHCQLRIMNLNYSLLEH